MNYKDKLPDLIDGLLPLDEEKAIFARLAEDEELLYEYKALNSIVNTIHSSISQYTPTNQATNAVFAQLGIQLPMAENQLSFVSGKEKLEKYSKASLALAASLALFFSISTLNKYSINTISIDSKQNQTVLKPDLVASANKNQNLPQSSRITPAASLNNSPIEVIKSENTDISDINVASQIAYNQLSNELYASQLPENSLSQLADFQDRDNLQDYKTVAFTMINNNPQSSNFENEDQFSSYSLSSEIPSAPNSLEFIENYSILNEASFTIELKNSIYFNTKESDKPSAKLNNIGLTILYQINDNFSAGVDFRDESFKLQSNENVETLSSNNSQPNSLSNIALTSIGVAVRYNFKEKGDSFYPSGQVILAKNREGVVGRVNLGISFKPIPGLTTTAGIEYSNLTYSSSSISYNSPKLGLNYGLAYNF